MTRDVMGRLLIVSKTPVTGTPFFPERVKVRATTRHHHWALTLWGKRAEHHDGTPDA